MIWQNPVDQMQYNLARFEVHLCQNVSGFVNIVQEYRPQGFKTPLVPLTCSFCIFASIFLNGSAGYKAIYRFGIVLGVCLASAHLKMLAFSNLIHCCHVVED